jgi:hypothetical protein
MVILFRCSGKYLNEPMYSEYKAGRRFMKPPPRKTTGFASVGPKHLYRRNYETDHYQSRSIKGQT